MRLPSGDHATSVSLPSGSFVRLVSPVPSMFTTQMSRSPLPRWNAIRRPSGEIDGDWSLFCPLVTARSPPVPSEFMTWMSRS
jgi:hypothetical protein